MTAVVKGEGGGWGVANASARHINHSGGREIRSVNVGPRAKTAGRRRTEGANERRVMMNASAVECR